MRTRVHAASTVNIARSHNLPILKCSYIRTWRPAMRTPRQQPGSWSVPRRQPGSVCNPTMGFHIGDKREGSGPDRATAQRVHSPLLPKLRLARPQPRAHLRQPGRGPQVPHKSRRQGGPPKARRRNSLKTKSYAGGDCRLLREPTTLPPRRRPAAAQWHCRTQRAKDHGRDWDGKK